jgi:DinB family protein
MNESERLARQFERALFGEAWYGPSWREVLEGVSGGAANHRPIAGAHTILEVALHATTWHEAVRRRLQGESPQVSDAEDWPGTPGEAAWSVTRDRLLETGRALCDAIRSFPAERIHELRPGLKETWYDLILGELQHVLYHAGQVGLLKKASVPVNA